MSQARWTHIGLVAALLGAVVSASGVAQAAPKVKVNVWQPWSGTSLAGMNATAKAFEKLHPGISVNMILVPNSIDTNEKFFVAMAGGKPPEIIAVDGTQVAQWALKGVLADVGKMMRQDGILADAFFAPSYKQCQWKGKTYAVPFESGTIPLGYSTAALASAGLPGPANSFDELEAWARKMDQTDSSGAYTRSGFQPLATPTWANKLFALGFAFGAEFLDEGQTRFTLDHPKAVEAMDWLISYYTKRGLNKYLKGFSSGYADLLKGKVGIMPILGDFPAYAALSKVKHTDWTWGLMPGPVENPSAFVGGWTFSIPSNAAHQKEAWEFLKFMCVEKEGTYVSWKNTGWFPSAKGSKVYTDVKGQDVDPFIAALKIARHQRPISPATPFIFHELEKQGPLMWSGKKTAAQALTEANATVQKELTKLLAKAKK